MTSCTLDGISIPVSISTTTVSASLTSVRTFGLHYSHPSYAWVSISLSICDDGSGKREGRRPHLVAAHDGDTMQSGQHTFAEKSCAQIRRDAVPSSATRKTYRVSLSAMVLIHGGYAGRTAAWLSWNQHQFFDFGIGFEKANKE